MRVRRALLIAVVVVLAALATLVVALKRPATIPAMRMTVVDDADGRPMAGVVAMFWGTAREGTLSGHGGRGALLFAAEAVSDASGELRFPAQRFDPQPFFLNTNYEGPTLMLLQPGYAPLEIRNEPIVPTLAQASRWDHDGETVRMHTTTPEEQAQRAYVITLRTNQMVGFELGCTWKRVPRALVRADRMFPDPGMMTSLRGLLFNDALMVEHGCGSPTTFFEPYLRP